ncbi:MAG: hypothetical protein ACTSU8_02630 [Alphaproteobacteria bacterium]
MHQFLENPENFLHSLNLKTGRFEFIEADRKTLSSLPFLDYRFIGEGSEKGSVPVQRAFQILKNANLKAPAKPVNFIFHSAFCCSTMIAKTLDIEGKNLSLKEPFALLGLAQYKKNRRNFSSDDPNWRVLLDMTLNLLSRPHLENEKTLIKPSNAANNLANEVLNSRLTGNVLFLYSPLERFLISVLNGGVARTGTINQLFSDIVRDQQAHLPIELHEIGFLSPLKKASLMWGLQVTHFQRIAEGETEGRIKTLDCETFLDSPEKTLGRLADFFDFEISSREIENILEGPTFRTHSKDPDLRFSKKDWEVRKKEILRGSKSRVNAALRFAEDLGFPVEGNLPAKLLKN